MKHLLKLSSTSLCLFFLSYNANGQRKPTDPKHENHYSVSPVSSEKVNLDFLESQSQQEFTLTKIKVTNKTSDYLIFKTKESAFKYDFGELKPTGGGMFQGSIIKVLPNDNKNITLKVSGEGRNYHVEKLTFIPNGFYSVPLEGKTQTTPDFKLPASANDFSAGSFKCVVDKIDKETKETKAVFKCVYNGKNVGIVDPNQIVVKLKSGQEYANDNREDKPALLFSGDDIKITAKFHVPGKVEDMQFANMDVVWKNTFKESELIPLQLKPTDFVLDPGLTAGKNK